MGKIVLFLLLLGQDEPVAKARDSIKADDLKARVAELADDGMAGRNAGTKECDAAAKYVAEKFKSFGLEPVIQTFDFRVRNDSERRSTILPRMEKTSNVLAVIQGSERPDEVVLIGAHYDHVGKAGQHNPGRRKEKSEKSGDDIWNGADDNASGTAALLEIAEAFASLKPKRTIVLIAFSAEEHGLLGSEYYRRNPVGTLDKTVLAINLDMIGRESEKGVGIHGAGTGQGLRAVVEKAAQETGLKPEIFDFGDIREPESDHATFYEAGIPTLFFFTGLHDDYHQSSDHADLLNYGSMERIARAVFLVSHDASEAPERMKFVPGRKFGILQAGPLPENWAKALKLAEGCGGLVVIESLEGSVAQAAGIQSGDFLVEIDGVGLPLRETRKGFHRLIDALPAGRSFSVVILRRNQANQWLKIELKAEFK